MPSKVYRRPAPSPQYQPGPSAQTVLLPTSNVIRKLWVTLTSQPTLTAGNNTVAKTLPGDDLAGYQFKLRYNGGDTALQLSGRRLWLINKFLLGSALQNPPLNTNLGDGATANPSLQTTLQLPIFECPINKRPADTWVWPGNLSSFNLDVTFPTSYTQLNGSATGWTTNPQCQVNGLFSTLGVRQRDSLMNPALKAGSFIYPAYGMRLVEQSQVYSGAANNQTMNLPSGRFGYRGLLVEATTTASPPVETAGLITNLQLLNGNVETLVDIPESILNQVTYDGGLRNFQQANTGIAFSVQGQISGSNSNTAVYWIDLCPDGQLQESVWTNSNDQLQLNFNLSAGCTINVVPVQMLQLPSTSGSPSF